MSIVSEALKLADRSIAAFPCGADKKSLTKHGFKDATADLPQIREWWREFPEALIGVPTGERFVVVDCDLQHAGAMHWYEHATIPPTRAHMTKSGGRHLLFRPDDRVRCSAGKIWPHIDTRGSGGYIIWWPAEGLAVLHGGTLAEIPEWIIKKLESKPEPEPLPVSRPVTVKSAHCKVDGIVGAIATAPQGQRNALLHWGACRLSELVQQSILTAGDAFALAVEAGTRTGLPYAEVSRTAKRIIMP